MRLSALTSLPAKSGLKTVGPRIAPKTDPKSTYEMPRARRSGGYMSPAAVRTSSADALDEPVRMKPTITASVEPTCVPSAVTAQPVPPTMKPTIEHGPAAVAVHRAPGDRAGARGGDEEDRRAEAEQPLDAGDEDERQRRHGRDELHDGRVDGERRREDQRVAADDPVEV